MKLNTSLLKVLFKGLFFSTLTATSIAATVGAFQPKKVHVKVKCDSENCFIYDEGEWE